MTKAGETHWPIILLLDNNEKTVFVFRRALTELSCACHLHVVETVAAARDCMENASAYKKSNYFAKPDLVVCAFEPMEEAIDFARWVSSDARFQNIPVVMLLRSDSQVAKPEPTGLRGTTFLRQTEDITELGNRLRPVLEKLAPA